VLSTSSEFATPVIAAPKPNPTGVIGGIIIGVTAALLYQRFYRVKLPSWLAFFGGRRFVPIVTAFAALLLGIIFGWVWPPIGQGLNNLGDLLTSNGAIGAGIYGALNRLLLPFGLHHIVNSLVWFVFGSFQGPAGVVHGDLNRFLAGDPELRHLHGRVLPGDDVRPAGRRPGDLAQRPAVAAQGGRRHHAVGRALLPGHRRDRADRVHVPVRGAGAVRRARGADRCVVVAGGGARGQGRLRLFGRPDRLPAETSARPTPPSRCCCCSSARSTRWSTTGCSAS
jgi:phosphotransferase system  glucose/maltose/N-acetylglucosamine-specific IIC component